MDIYSDEPQVYRCTVLLLILYFYLIKNNNEAY